MQKNTVISKYVSQKREQNANSFHAPLLRLVKNFMDKYGSLQFDSDVIWYELINNWPGMETPNKPMSFDSEKFGW